jgi:hypothetical protein
MVDRNTPPLILVCGRWISAVCTLASRRKGQLQAQRGGIRMTFKYSLSTLLAVTPVNKPVKKPIDPAASRGYNLRVPQSSERRM